MSNASTVIYHGLISLEHFQNKPINWCGFYITDPKNDQQLILGPFQGKVNWACYSHCRTSRIDIYICNRLHVLSFLLVRESVVLLPVPRNLNWSVMYMNFLVISLATLHLILKS